ncbi:MAG: DUF3800 domain-containing protein [Phycisphaerae bacterium]
MLIFFDETFRTAKSGHQMGALCGIAIPEEAFGQTIADVYNMKYNSFGERFAKEKELKGSKLLKSQNFRPTAGEPAKASLNFVLDLIRYMGRQQFKTLGVVAFDVTLRTFKCNDPYRLELTYRSLFERIDGYMRSQFPNRRAKLVFDDVDYGTNLARAESIANFFNRTAAGRGYDTIIRTPFFSVSQAQNVGLQLADIVTTVVGMRFQGHPHAVSYWRELKKTIFRYRLGARQISTLKVFKASA